MLFLVFYSATRTVEKKDFDFSFVCMQYFNDIFYNILN